MIDADTLAVRVDGIEQRIDRRDKHDTAKESILWDAIEKIRERLDRLPAWAMCLIGSLTMIIGLLGGWIARSVFNS